MLKQIKMKERQEKRAQSKTAISEEPKKIQKS